MSRTLAIVHAPGVNQAQLNMFVEKLRDWFIGHSASFDNNFPNSKTPYIREESVALERLIFQKGAKKNGYRILKSP